MYTIKNRIWIEMNEGGKVLLGHGRVQLLSAIQEQGSLSRAAKSLQMSYKKAWDLVNSMNQAGTQPVVILQTGGKKGGGATLTVYGSKLVDVFKQVTLNSQLFLKEQEKLINTI
ncbi:LysR family transcriptional regulator [Aquimarina sp. ERC-38]|uniref:winged helix-turn-helix domain-containing protein n=1 Tax=Aquimarina sp. ERC-38 TaxID=2949996 RepID=UPI00224553B1|nr:LysR family transcriptional regulator [Aquimarina sp. ERC-38]UZO79250.1 LysR family transcriptional regulator [Aquimarina sp. ERC-38]